MRYLVPFKVEICHVIGCRLPAAVSVWENNLDHIEPRLWLGDMCMSHGSSAIAGEKHPVVHKEKAAAE